MTTAFAPLVFVVIMLGLVAEAKPADAAVRGVIVNLDVGDLGRASTVGREVAAGLASDPHTALVWEEVTQQEAETGLNKGTYHVAVVIPPDFSADLAQMADDPVGAPRASVDIAITDKNSINALAVGHEVARALNDVIAERVVAGALSRVSVQFSTLQSSMNRAAAEAATLSQRTEGMRGDAERAQAEARRLTDEVADARDDAERIARNGDAANPALARKLARALAQSEDRSARLADALDDAARDLDDAHQSGGRLQQAIAAGSVSAPEFLAPDNAGEVADALRAPVVLDQQLAPMAPDGGPIGRQAPTPVAPLLGMALAIIAVAVITWRPRRLPAPVGQEGFSRGYASSQPPVFTVAAATGAGCGLIAMALGFIGWSAALPVTLLLTVAGVVMAAVGDALAGWLGRAGVLVVIAWMVLLSQHLDGHLAGFGALSPLTAVTDGIRCAIDSEPTTAPMLALLAWLAGAIALGVWARYRDGRCPTLSRPATR